MGTSFSMSKVSENGVVDADIEYHRVHVLYRILELLKNLNMDTHYIIYLSNPLDLDDETDEDFCSCIGDRMYTAKEVSTWVAKMLEDNKDLINQAEETLLKLSVDDLKVLRNKKDSWFEGNDVDTINDLKVFRRQVDIIFTLVRDGYVFHTTC